MAKPASREKLIKTISELIDISEELEANLEKDRNKGDLVWQDISEEIDDMQRKINLIKIESNIKH